MCAAARVHMLRSRVVIRRGFASGVFSATTLSIPVYATMPRASRKRPSVDRTKASSAPGTREKTTSLIVAAVMPLRYASCRLSGVAVARERFTYSA